MNDDRAQGRCESHKQGTKYRDLARHHLARCERSSRPRPNIRVTSRDAKQIRVVALDLPTSWLLAAQADNFTGRMFGAINAMMLDVLAAVARKDYDDRRRRQGCAIAPRWRSIGNMSIATAKARSASPLPRLRGRKSATQMPGRAPEIACLSSAPLDFSGRVLRVKNGHGG